MHDMIRTAEHSSTVTAKEKTLGFTMVHSAGHQSGLGHSGSIPLMWDAQDVNDQIISTKNGRSINECYNCIEDFQTADDWGKWFESMTARFGNKNP